MDVEAEAIEAILKKHKKAELIVDVFTMEMIWVTESFAKKFGYTKAEMDHMSLREVLFLDISEIAKLLANLVNNPREEFQTVKGKNKKKIDASGDVMVFNYKNNPYLVVENVKTEAH